MIRLVDLFNNDLAVNILQYTNLRTIINVLHTCKYLRDKTNKHINQIIFNITVMNYSNIKNDMFEELYTNYCEEKLYNNYEITSTLFELSGCEYVLYFDGVEIEYQVYDEYGYELEDVKGDKGILILTINVNLTYKLYMFNPDKCYMSYNHHNDQILKYYLKSSEEFASFNELKGLLRNSGCSSVKEDHNIKNYVDLKINFSGLDILTLFDGAELIDENKAESLPDIRSDEVTEEFVTDSALDKLTNNMVTSHIETLTKGTDSSETDEISTEDTDSSEIEGASHIVENINDLLYKIISSIEYK